PDAASLLCPYPHPQHPHLHSFPTRRSSDLNLSNNAFRAFSGLVQTVKSNEEVSSYITACKNYIAAHRTKNIQVREISTAVGMSQDRKSTRLNSSHVSISYAVFCLKKKTHIT